MTAVVQKPSHLDWIELSFERGMWTSGGPTHVPEGGAQVLENLQPQLGGGVRPAVMFSEFSKAGVGAGEYPAGLYAQSNIPERAGGSNNVILYLVTYNPTTFVGRIYQWDKTQTVDPVAWTLIKTFAAGTGPYVHAAFTEYTLTVSPTGTHVYLSYRAAASDDGLWRIQYTTGAADANSTVTKVASPTNPNAITTHQDRIVLNVGNNNGSRIIWNDPGTETFAAANFLDVLPYYRSTGAAFLKSWVTDLMIGKSGAPFTLVSGDLDDPFVRVLLDAHYPTIVQVPAETAEGIVYSAVRDGVYATSSGSDVKKLSMQLDASDSAPDDIYPFPPRAYGSVNNGSIVSVGDLVYLATGMVYDRRTQAWFRQSDLHDEYAAGRPPKVMYYDPSIDSQTLWIATESTSFRILYAMAFDEAPRRGDTYYLSPPIRHPSGRNVRVRKVQVVVDAPHEGSAVVVEVNGFAHSFAIADAGRQSVTANFLQERDVLDVGVRTSSNGAGEAPSIETVRVGIQAGHLQVPSGSPA